MNWNPLTDIRLIVLFLMLIIAFVVSLAFGSVSISIEELWQILAGNSSHEVAENIILQHRLPRTLAAILTGISLPLSGWVLQEFFRNPLAGPSVLGITSAAGLGVAILIVIGSVIGISADGNGVWSIMIGAMIGGFLAALLVVGFASKIPSTSTLIIIGFMIAAICGALVGILEYFASGRQLKSFVLWGFGSFNGLTWRQLAIYTIMVFLGLILVLNLIKPLMTLQLGEKYAQTMGIDLKYVRLLIIISASLLASVSTAFVGPIAFIGLAVPHICRVILRTSNFYKLFSYVLIVGMLLMLICTLLAEWFPGGSLPINIVTSLIGAPVVISIIFNRKYFIQ